MKISWNKGGEDGTISHKHVLSLSKNKMIQPRFLADLDFEWPVVTSQVARNMEFWCRLFEVGWIFARCMSSG
jgi:hypothetical protein